MPQLDASLLGYLPRDSALHTRHVDADATQKVHEQLRTMFFMIESADELLVKPKNRRTLN